MGNVLMKNEQQAVSLRIEWVDVLRGVLIIFVVAGHYYNGSDFQMITYWFHMPCFVLLSGYLSKGKKISCRLILHKFQHMLVPGFVYSLPILFYYGGVGTTERCKFVVRL